MANLGIEARSAQTPPRQEAAANLEMDSRKKVALVTGGSRDIGEKITRSLLARGVTVVTTNRKERNSVEYRNIRDDVASSGGILHSGDITKPEVQQELGDIVDGIGGKIDFLVLSAADGSLLLNVDTNLALMRRFLPKMGKGGVVVEIQSHPGYFRDVLDERILFKEYVGVAASKFAEKEEVAAEMRDNPDAEGKKLIEVVIPSVLDTTNANLFKRKAPEAKDNLPALARSLGLPEYSTTDQVGEVVAGLIDRRDELPDKYTEFFSNTTAAKPKLREMYGEPAIYLDTVEGDLTGHTLVSESRIREAGKRLVTESSGDLSEAFSEVTITEEDCIGHFDPDSVPPEDKVKTLAGWRRIEVAVDTLKNIYEELRPGKTWELAALEFAKFGRPVAPGDVLSTIVKRVGYDKQGAAIYDAEIISRQKSVATLKGMQFREVDKDNITVRPGQVVEAVGQNLIVADSIANPSTSSKLPLLEGMEGARFGYLPGKGGEFSTRNLLKDENGGISVSATVRSDGHQVARIRELKAKMADAGRVMKMLKNAQIAALRHGRVVQEGARTKVDRIEEDPKD